MSVFLKTVIFSILIFPAFSSISAEEICGYPLEKKLEVYRGPVKISAFSVGIADNLYQRKKGLQGCTHMKKGRGLLFIFPRAKLRYFWMKNTPLPLAVIFISSEGDVISVKRGIPNNEELIYSEKKASFVLEVNWEEGKNIHPNDVVSFL